MVQIYLFSEVYLLLAASIILSDRYGSSILILFNIKALYESKKIFRLAGIACGLVLVVLMCLFPIDPGPRFLGDFLPEVTILLVVIRIVVNHSHEKDGSKVKTGFFCLFTAIIHMIMPSIVIL